MATYCTDAMVLDHLPDGLPEDVDSEAERAGYIVRASALADGLVGPAFAAGAVPGSSQKFPDVAESPATPGVISEMAALLAAAMVLDHIGFGNLAGESGGDALRLRAMELADGVRRGDVDVVDSAGTRYGESGIESTSGGAEPVFTVGRYGEDGTCLSEGSLDDMG